VPRGLWLRFGMVAGKARFPAGEGGMFGFEPFEHRPVGIARGVDQPGDDPDGMLDTLGTDGLHDREDRAEGRSLPIATEANCSMR